MSIKKALIILAVIAIVGILVISAMSNGKSEVEYTTAVVEMGDIVQTVSETGTVKSIKEIDLSFMNTGQLAKVNYPIGTVVKAGQILAELDYSNLLISQEDASASLDAAQQKLNKLLSGATAEEIAVSRASFDQAKASYDAAVQDLARTKAQVNENINQAEKSLDDLTSTLASDLTSTEQSVLNAQTSLKNSKVTYQQAINNAQDSGLISVDNKLSVAQAALNTVEELIFDEDLDDYLSVNNASYMQATKLSYKQAIELLAEARESLTGALVSQSPSAVVVTISKSLTVLSKTFEALTNCFSVLENTEGSILLSQAILDVYKSSITAQQSSVATGQTALSTAKQTLDSAILNYDTQVSAAIATLDSAQATYNDAVITAENALNTAQLSGEKQLSAAESAVYTTEEAMKVAEAQYQKVVAPANPHDVALARAQVRQAQAAYDTILNRIENSQIKAPIDGTITKIEYEVGEQVMSGSPVISMLGENKFEIEVLISEADISKVAIGDKVIVDLDAFGEDEKFNGEIFFVEPAETVIQDVIYYQVDISFDPRDLDVKSGMTANATITTAEKKNILIAPSRAVVDKNGSGKFIRVLEDGALVEKKVVVGLKGDGGVVEIVDGIDAGTEVVTYVKDLK